MKNHYVNQLTSGMLLKDEPFLIQDAVRRTTRDERLFLLLTLRDKTGQIGGVFWDVPDTIAAAVAAGDVMLISGQVTTYKETLQISATHMRRWATPDLSIILPASQRPREEMMAELEARVAALSAPWQGLMEALLLAEPVRSQFANSPAARYMHHAFIGGLLEHSLSMAKLADWLSDHYAYVNKDLLIAGALVHDIGKVYEYDPGAAFNITPDGRLVGHITRAIVLVEQVAASLGDIDPADVQQLVHLIAAHHGQLEWASPVKPRTIEAILLHQIDMIDSRLQGFYDFLNQEAQFDEAGWSLRPSKMFSAELLRPDGWPTDGNATS